MAKQCMYCGQPLSNDDARVCNNCGQFQVVPNGSASPAEQAPIRVKLPPKEYVRDDAPAPRPASFTSEWSANPVPPLPRTQQPARLPKRPMRPTPQEAQGQGEQPGASRAMGSTPAQSWGEQPEMPGAPGSIHSKTMQSQRDLFGSSQPQPSTPAQPPQGAPEESTMVLPGWQEELESLRKERQGASSPSASEQRTPPAPPEATLRRPQSTPIPEAFNAPGQPNAGAEQPGRRPDERARAAEQSQRAFSTQSWEQGPASQSSMQRRVPGPGPAPAVEQTPFSPLPFGAEERAGALADRETVAWQIAGQPPSTPQQAPGKHGTQLFDEQSGKGALEDLPTVASTTVKGQPQLKAERASTPYPGNGPSAQAARQENEVVDLPTRPMPASFSGPRSPLPSSGPRTPLPPSRPVDLPALENRRTSQPSNPPSSPGSYGQLSGFGPSSPTGRSANPSSQPGFGPAGRSANPSSQPGFGSANPPSQPGFGSGPANGAPSRPGSGFGPSNPPSQPGNPPPWAEARAPWQSGESGPVSYPRVSQEQLPNTPRPGQDQASTAARSSLTRYRGRVAVIAVVLLLVVGGILAALSYQHNQSVTNQATQPTQHYQNSALGVSLDYPQSWKVSADQAHNSAHFADNSATVQVDLRQAAANGSLDQYLNQQASQLGITNQKVASAVTFAGASWQQLQGSINQSGATYTITLYVTQHNGHFYTLACLTLPPVYAQAEHDSFAPLRASLQFLA